jgi:hypothetical protein
LLPIVTAKKVGMLTEPHGVTWHDLGLVALYLGQSCIFGADVNGWEGVFGGGATFDLFFGT